MGAIKCNDTLAVSIHRIRNSDLNEHGTVYGGRILELIDGQASVAAMRVARTTVATVSMDEIQFCDHLTFKIQCVWRHTLSALGSDQLKCLQK